MDRIPKKFLRRQAVAERYDVDARTIDRMKDDGRLPRPHYRGRLPIWDEDELTASDRAAAIAAKPAGKHA